MNATTAGKLLCAAGLAAIFATLELRAQTSGGATFEGTIKDYNGSGTKHWAVAWVTDADGRFIKTLRKQGPSWTSTHWGSHCQVWNNARGGSASGSQAFDGYSSATAADYSGTNSPIIWTWNCRDANNDLVPDGNYKFWLQYAEDSGQGPHTTNGLLWVKGPAATTTTYPNLAASFANLKVTWVSVVPPPTPPAITAVALQANHLVLSGTGTAARTYHVLTSTNLALATAWTPLATNAIDSSGKFAFTNPVNSSVPHQFYRLKMP